MSNEIKHENRYWLVNENVYELHFTYSVNDEILLKFIQDVHDHKKYIYVSDFLRVEYDEIISESAEDVKEQLEYMVMERIEDMITYYKEMLEKFKEEA